MKNRTFLLVLAALVFFTVPPMMHGQQKIASQQQTEIYSCPMHPDVTSTKPGNCSKCGMALVKVNEQKASTESKTTARDKVHEAKKLLLDAKKQLAREGKYSCCTQDPCNQCLLDHQSCSCERDVKAGKPVCPECYGGWQRGEGKFKSIKPSDVKTEFSGHKH